MAVQQLRFPPFRLDVVNNLLWREEHQIPLRPKTLAVLRVLVEKSGQVVSRDELLHAVWGGTVVSDNVLKVCVSEIREALGDDSTKPRFIETLPRQGYRFIAPLSATQSVVSSQYPVVSRKEGAGDSGLGTSSSPQAPSLKPLAPSLVGRDAELAQLMTCWQRALSGERQLVFITGEPGIGKTALVDAFVTHARSTPGAGVGRGQCIEHYGAGEAYLPVLEALEQSAHTPAREQVTALLNQYAPLWLAQMPALLSASDRERLQRELQGVTQDRMLREMAAFLEALTAVTPLVVVLEDLHWSDAATLTLLSAIARRRQPARLLVIGTYRPADVPDRQLLLPGIMKELRLHQQCKEMGLSLLRENAVAAYITERFAGQPVPTGLVDAIYQQTDGNPLFMVNLVDHVLSQQATLPQVVSPATLKPVLGQLPESLQQMLTYQIERLKEAERHMLEAASVAGMEFSATTLAAALGSEALEVEHRCDDLVQRQTFLRRLPLSTAGLANEGSIYAFRHALQHSLFYDRVGMLRRQQMHQRIGERKEQMARSSGIEMSAELAAHFMASGDAQRSVMYLQHAARTALRRSAHHEARTHLSNALEWLMRLPKDETRTQRELELQLMLGVTLMSTQGFSSTQVQQTYAQAHQLCQQLGSTPQLFPALWGLRSFYHVRAEYNTAREIAAQLLQVAESTQSADLLVEGHLALGTTLVFQGELQDALHHLEACLERYNQQQHQTHAYAYGQDPAVLALCHLASLLVGMGYFDQALTRIQRAVTIAEEIGHPFSLGYALCFAGAIHSGRGEAHLTLQHAEQAIALAQRQGFPHLQIMGALLAGWARAELGQPEEGAAQLQQALDAQKRIGFEVGRSFYLTLLAEVYCKAGQHEPGLAAVNEGLDRVQQKGEWFYAADLYRIKGELTLVGAGDWGLGAGSPSPQVPSLKPQVPKEVAVEAEGDFLKAIDIARQQTTKLFELRATMGLCRLWHLQGKTRQARERLRTLYDWFTEGSETPELQKARVLLAELS